MDIIYTEKCLEYGQPGHPESARRVSSTVNLIGFAHRVIAPSPAEESELKSVHSSAHIERVQLGSFVDWDTPAYPHIFQYASLSAGAAVMAAQRAISGTPAFSLMRPPGHHAGRDSVAGFCYFNNIAVAVQTALKHLDKVAIIDFDCHHGNGTQSIFLGNSHVLYISLHQSPLFPESGLRSEGNCLNFPLPAGISEAEHFETFTRALGEVRHFRPDLLAVSAGFDSFKGDPITDMNLEITSFEKIGREISRLGTPTFSVLEGGYADELSECVAAYLKGLES